MRDNGIVLVEVGVQWTTGDEYVDGGEDWSGDLRVSASGQHVEVKRFEDGEPDTGLHPVLTPEQARRVGWALIEAADKAEAEAKDA